MTNTTPTTRRPLLTSDSPSFGWGRAGLYTLVTLAMWTACWFVTRLVAQEAGASWIDPGMPGAGAALAYGVAWEYVRRDRARHVDRD